MKQAFPCRPLSCRPLVLGICLVAVLPALALAVEPLHGEWEGDLTMPDGTSRHVIIELQQGGDGSWTGRIQAGADRTQHLELDRLSVSGSAVNFRFTNPQDGETAIFSGSYQAWSDQIKGIFRVRGFSLPIMMNRVGAGVDGQLTGTAADSALVDAKVVRTRHENNFAVSFRGSLWNPLYVLKEDARDINDITTASSGYDASLRWYIIDDLALFGRYVQGGLGFDTNESNLGLFNFSGDEFLEMKGWEFGLNAYWGDVIFPNSDFNPYATAVIGKIEWSVGTDGRGSDPYQILETPLEAKDYGVGFGLGTEYPVTKALAVEFEWMWRYILTEDLDEWSDQTLTWTNTNAWSLSLGMVANF
jgi:opacity protein-like surface antigen